MVRLQDVKNSQGDGFHWEMTVPKGFELPQSLHQNFVPIHHKDVSSEKISLFQIWEKKTRTVRTVSDAQSFFEGQRSRHPLNMSAVDFVLANTSELIESSNLTEEINLILFIASVFPSTTSSVMVVVGIHKVARDHWQVLPRGYDIQKSFDPSTTAIAIYNMV